jgi:uncharacterized lipoprotein YajG
MKKLVLLGLSILTTITLVTSCGEKTATENATSTATCNDTCSATKNVDTTLTVKDTLKK